MPYVIQNTRSGSYMCYDLNHRLSATSNVRKAESFEDSGKAYNVLTHCYPKSKRPDWQVVELPREAAKPDPEQAVRCSDMEANVRGSLRHVVSWPEVADTLQHKSQEKGYDYDANWLEVAIQYSNQNEVEGYKDACLLTYELEELIDGLSEVIAAKESLYISDFMEPYLKFAIASTDGKILLGMEFVYEANKTSWKSHKVSEVITKESAEEIAEELRSMLARFPQR